MDATCKFRLQKDVDFSLAQFLCLSEHLLWREANCHVVRATGEELREQNKGGILLIHNR